MFQQHHSQKKQATDMQLQIHTIYSYNTCNIQARDVSFKMTLKLQCALCLGRNTNYETHLPVFRFVHYVRKKCCFH